jgi:hypothetical protein
VESPDPERILANLRPHGELIVLDRTNLVLDRKQGTTYLQSRRISVPQLETRNDQEFVRYKFENAGTRLSVNPRPDRQHHVVLSVSFVLERIHGIPSIATAEWEQTMELPVGRTVILRSWHPLSRHRGRTTAIGGRNRSVECSPSC